MPNTLPAGCIPIADLVKSMSTLVSAFKEADKRLVRIVASAVYDAVLNENGAYINFILAELVTVNPKIAPAIRNCLLVNGPFREKDGEKEQEIPGHKFTINNPLKVFLKDIHEGGRFAGLTPSDFFQRIDGNTSFALYKSTRKTGGAKAMTQEDFDKTAKNLVEKARKNDLDTSKFDGTSRQLHRPSSLLAFLEPLNQRNANFTKEEQELLAAFLEAAAKYMESAKPENTLAEAI